MKLNVIKSVAVIILATAGGVVLADETPLAADSETTAEEGWTMSAVASDGSSICTNGELVIACTPYSSLEVNGVTFTTRRDASLFADYVVFSPTYAGLAMDNDTTLGFVDWTNQGKLEQCGYVWTNGEASVGVTLRGLTSGTRYLFQAIVHNGNSEAADMTVSAGGASALAVSGRGASLAYAFTATATTQNLAIGYAGGGRRPVNFFQLRNLGKGTLSGVALTIPDQDHMRLAKVTYGGKAAIQNGDNVWMVGTNSTVTVEFVAETGYELAGNPVLVTVGEEAMELTTFPTATAITLPDDGVTLTKVGEYSFSVDGCGGIAYSGADNLFYVLQDHDANGKSAVYPLTLGIDAETGAVVSQTLGTAFAPGDNTDSEGIAYDAASGKLWVSDESTPSIAEFDLTGAASGRTAPVPAVQKSFKVTNKSLESLTLSPNGLTMWTANEEALTCDGAISSTNIETLVRLTKFTRASRTADWAEAGEWAYACDTCQPSFVSSYQQCGVSGLCALADGSLLVLEREVSTATWGRCRIYRVTPYALSKATEVSGLPALAEAVYTGVPKGTALVEFEGSGMSSIQVYEGIALGPKLSDGSRGVYLVSDGGATKTISIFTAKTVDRICALRLSGVSESAGWTDWPADPDAEITEATLPAELGITAGAFASSGTTTAELRKLSAWGRANGVTFGGTEVNALSFDENGNPLNDFTKAYLLNCAETHLSTEEPKFKFASITPGVIPSIDDPGYNGVAKVEGSAKLGTEESWEDADASKHYFFRARLIRK